MQKRLVGISALAALISVLLAVRVYVIGSDEGVIKASAGRGQYRISDVCEYASIYDCKGERLNNYTYSCRALINPNSPEALRIAPFAEDQDAYRSGMSGNLPFLCKVKTDEIPSAVIFKKYIREEKDQPAKHIVGYISDGEGVCGIEYAYNDFLHGIYSSNEAEFSVNAVGGVLDGLCSDVSYAEELDAGVLTTIDKNIQQICERAMKESGIKKGAAAVMNIKNGEIRACASFPEFCIEDLEKSLGDKNSPFVNRAFSAYSVGSIFKLVTASAALESGISPDFSYTCAGSADVNGQIFNCHKWGGHGEINMKEAIKCSCNPYFITLSEYISSSRFIETAEKFGFGSENFFAKGLVSSRGYLPSERELSVKAEKANFSFGQGKLTATPVQICAMTAAIANNGIYNEPRIILGTKDAMGNVELIEYPAGKRAVSYLTAIRLRGFMAEVVNAENSMARSYKISGAGKTSTAQTGRVDSEGKEEFNCWFTGYFPAEDPKYAVTILAENGISGNVTCGPVYRQIAENITAYEKQRSVR